MEIYHLLNLVILTLTATTILLTLVSFLLYKMRQLPGIQSRKDGALKITGVFFTRYVPQRAPRLRDIPVVVFNTPVENGAHGASKILPRGVVGFFAVLGSVVFAALLVGGYLQRISLSGIRPRVADYKELRKMGLLQTFDYARMGESGLLEETLSSHQRSRERNLVEALSKRTIFLFTPECDRSRSPWKESLKRSGVPFRSVTRVSSARSGTLLIAPRIWTLSAGQLSALKEALPRGISVLATGIAYDDGRMREAFGVSLLPRPNADPEHPLPTVFAADSPPFWDLPPGILLDWFPLENRYEAVGVRGVAAAFEASRRGLPRVPWATRAQFVDHGAARSAWLAFDPETLKAGNGTEEFYGRQALLSSLAWAARVPQARVATWKGGRRSAFVASVDAEEQFGNASGLADLFRESRIPSTFFPYSDFLLRSSGLAKEWVGEIAAHAENADSLVGASVETRFDSIQRSRHQIEEIARSPVIGFRPPGEKYDEGTVSAVIQNQLTYLFGDSRFPRLAPLWIGSGRLLFIPRVASDDFHIERRWELETSREIADYLAGEFERIHRLNGAHFLSLHTQSFGQPPYREPLRLFFEHLQGRKPWITHLAELADWWKSRDPIHVTLAANDDGSFGLRVVNPGARAVEGVSVRIDAPSREKLQLDADPSAPSANLSLGDDGIWAVHLERIDRGQELRLRLKPSSLSVPFSPPR